MGRLRDLLLLLSIVLSPALPAQSEREASPIAKGCTKFLGGAFSAAQATGFTRYWNKVTPENAGKWGVVESVRDRMDWSGLDAAYALAQQNDLPFHMHVLVWGNQQPAWIETLPPQEQLAELREWFEAVAARYPDIAFVEVVNEPLHDPPSQRSEGGGAYMEALGGAGASGWDWVINAFRMAREYFPRAQLLINEYDVTNKPANARRYKQIVDLLRASNLIDAVGVQGHAFSTRADVPVSTLVANLDLLASAGLPLYVTELDIDGPTDEAQLRDAQRIFPAFWRHTAVRGITVWGFRPGNWRSEHGAFLVRIDGAERPAMQWLRSYVSTGCAAALTAQSTRDAATMGRIERLDPALDAILPADAKVEKVAEGFTWAEGPVWISQGNYLLFTDVPANTMHRWSASAGVSIFLKPSGYEGTDLTPFREAGANGLAPDRTGSILLADSGNRVVSRLSLASKQKTPLAATFSGRRFNSPNDLVRRADGAIYFTDPPYGLKGLNESPLKELRFNGVFRLDPDGEVALIDDQLTFPNGIALSPDERTLYVSNSDPSRPVWIAYTLNATGDALSRRVFADASDLVGKDAPGLPDGLAIAADGNLFATAPGGVLIMTPDGRRIGLIATGAPISNCAFGDDGRTLYMTSKNMLARIRLSTRGVGF
jgi:sugar lactone lactonase YvrE/GH35 family endo-1,4-beta-xylanase